MTSMAAIQCTYCARWRSPLDSGLDRQTCEAYPTGIPDAIWNGSADHRKSYPGDRGLRWKSDDGAKYPTAS